MWCRTTQILIYVRLTGECCSAAFCRDEAISCYWDPNQPPPPHCLIPPVFPGWRLFHSVYLSFIFCPHFVWPGIQTSSSFTISSMGLAGRRVVQEPTVLRKDNDVMCLGKEMFKCLMYPPQSSKFIMYEKCGNNSNCRGQYPCRHIHTQLLLSNPTGPFMLPGCLSHWRSDDSCFKKLQGWAEWRWMN